MKAVYMEVTRDRFELPIAVADSAHELARMRGVCVTNIIHGCSTTQKRTIRRSKYKRVWIDENEEE